MSDSDEPAGGGGILRALLGAAFAIVLVYWIISVRSVPTATVSRRLCERAWESARTAADTAAADSIVLPGERDSLTARRCGSLRSR